MAAEDFQAPDSPGPKRVSQRLALECVGLGLLLLAECALFQKQIHASAWIYPRWYDQVQYLAEAYRGYDYRLDHGFLPALSETLLNPSEQGTLHDFWALWVFSLLGPTRAAALDVNLLGFVALQAVTFFAVRRATRSAAMAWISAALILALQAPWADATGSVTDFRLDWMAACAYGVALAAAISTGGFRSTRGSAVFGLAVTVALLTRFLSGVYMALVIATLFLGLAVQRDRWPRLARLTLSAAIAAALAAPIYWINRTYIYNYYWIGHVAGPERPLRDSHLGLLPSMEWLLSELLWVKFGIPGLAILGGVIAALVYFRRNAIRPGAVRKGPALRGGAAVALVFLLAPAAVLLIHPVKAPQTVSILLAPLVWLGVLGCAGLARKVSGRTLAATAGVALAAACLVFCFGATRRPFTEDVVQDARKMNALADYVFFRSEECGLLHPRVGATLMAAGLSADAFAVLNYERHQRWLDFNQTLPTGLFETDPATVMDRLSKSDFVFLLSRGDVLWPFDHQLMGMLPETRSWCGAHLRHLADLQVQGFELSVYERRGLERPGGGTAVELKRMLRDEPIGSAAGVPPSAPVLVSSRHVLWSAGREFRVNVHAAYSPVRYRISGLPEGLSFNPRTGEIRGVARSEGTFVAQVTASNAVGSVREDLRLSIGNGAFLTSLEAPASARLGVTAPFVFEAYHAGGKLDFIDMTDLTVPKALVRLAAPDEGQWGWQGSYLVAFSSPGRHTVQVRFVCFDPVAKDPYSYADQVREVMVSP